MMSRAAPRPLAPLCCAALSRHRRLGLFLASAVLLVACSRDADGDGYEVGVDCDDSSAGVHPAAVEVCNGIDDNCDGAVDDDDPTVDLSTGRRFFADEDQDGFGRPEVFVEACEVPEGFVDGLSDCDDTTADANPDATEVCDGIDNDCDELVDDADDSLDLSTTTTYWVDGDGDGHGWRASSGPFCVPPEGYVDLGDDCNDEDASINPGETDIPQDGIDQDCSGDDAPYTIADLIEGDLVITEILSDPDAVDDSVGQWFEICNQSGGRLDLGGLYVANDGSESFTVSGPLLVEADDYTVFGSSSDTAANGGVTIDYSHGGAMTLGADAERIVLAEGSDLSLVYDQVTYGGDKALPDGPGVSAQLSDRTWDATANDAAINWCPSAVPFGDGDLGTPGADNDVCPYSVGNTEPLDKSSNIAGNQWLGSRIVLDQPATLDRFGLIGTVAGRRFRMVLYTDRGGSPDVPIMETGAQTLAVGRQEVDVPDVELAAGTYYIMANYEYYGNVSFTTETSATVWYRPYSFDVAAPSPFGPATTYKNQEFAYYIAVY